MAVPNSIFLENKYSRWYFCIMDRAKERNWSKKTSSIYLENHHIIPKSIIKNNDVVLLTAREHFICHLLLPKMLMKDEHITKMQLAIHRLIHGNKNVCYSKSSHTYETIKKTHSEAASTRSKKYWQSICATERSERYTGEKNGRYGKIVSEETRQKISKANKGKLAGKDHPLYGIGHSEETKQKLRDNAIGRYVGSKNPMFGKCGAAKNKKWFHDPVEKTERYFSVGEQPINFKKGRLKNDTI